MAPVGGDNGAGGPELVSGQAPLSTGMQRAFGEGIAGAKAMAVDIGTPDSAAALLSPVPLSLFPFPIFFYFCLRPVSS